MDILCTKESLPITPSLTPGFSIGVAPKNISSFSKMTFSIPKWCCQFYQNFCFFKSSLFNSCFTCPTFIGHISLKNEAFFKWIFSSDPWDVARSFGTLHGQIHWLTAEIIATDHSLWNTPRSSEKYHMKKIEKEEFLCFLLFS